MRVLHLTLCSFGKLHWNDASLDSKTGFLRRHITEADLHFFQERIEQEALIPGAGKWEHMTDVRLDSLTYTAWRRRLPVRSVCDQNLHLANLRNYLVVLHEVWAQGCLTHTKLASAPAAGINCFTLASAWTDLMACWFSSYDSCDGLLVFVLCSSWRLCRAVRQSTRALLSQTMPLQRSSWTSTWMILPGLPGYSHLTHICASAWLCADRSASVSFQSLHVYTIALHLQAAHHRPSWRHDCGCKNLLVSCLCLITIVCHH